MNQEKNTSGQVISLIDRARLSINAVEDVVSFDDTSIILKSSYGMLSVDGRELRITRLSVETGELFIEGQIGGVIFFEPSETKKKRGLFR